MTTRRAPRKNLTRKPTPGKQAPRGAPAKKPAAKPAPAEPAGKRDGKSLGEKLIKKLTAGDPDGIGLGFDKITEDEKVLLNQLMLRVVRSAQTTRRRHSRIETRLDVQLKRDDRMVQAETKDLSLGGMFLVSDLPVEVGDLLEFVLYLPAGLPPVEGQARVVHAKQPADTQVLPGFGLQFIKADTAPLRQYLIMLVRGAVAPGVFEKRRHARIKRPMLARVATADTSEASQLVDISLSGAFLQTAVPTVVGTAVEMSVVNPLSLQRLRLTGKVVRVVDSHSHPDDPKKVRGTGVAFDEMDRQTVEQLLTFLTDIIALEATEN